MERSVITVRMHPGLLLSSLSFLIASLVAAVTLTALVSGIALLVIWMLWALGLLRFTQQIAAWSERFLALTDQRIMVISGLSTQEATIQESTIIPLSEITDLTFQRSTSARLFGYGTIIVDSAGRDQPLQEIKFVPNPKEFYLETVSRLLATKETGIVCPICHGEGTISEDVAEPAGADRDDGPSARTT